MKSLAKIFTTSSLKFSLSARVLSTELTQELFQEFPRQKKVLERCKTCKFDLFNRLNSDWHGKQTQGGATRTALLSRHLDHRDWNLLFKSGANCFFSLRNLSTSSFISNFSECSSTHSKVMILHITSLFPFLTFLRRKMIPTSVPW